MNIITTFRQMDGSDAVKNYAQEKIGKLQKFLREAMRADVTLSVDGSDHVADVHIKSGHVSVHGSESSDDMYASIDLVVDKLEAQIRSDKGKSDRSRRGMRAADFAESVSGERGDW
jgi:putative sigma-54 modulation protein